MLQVITSCTQRRGLLPMLEQQLSDAGIAFHVEPIDSMPNNVGNLGTKIKFMHRMLDKFGAASHLVFTDAWDVLFYGTEEEVIGKIPNGVPLLAAERNCWPDAYLAPNFKGSTPWRFVNGGLMAGCPEGIAKWIDEIESHPAYIPEMIDQQWLNHRSVNEEHRITPLDRRTELFHCCLMDQGELQFENGRPINMLCGTHPNFLHFNGKTDISPFMMRRMVSLPIKEGCKCR